jgi:hypothetical protein
VAPEDNWELIGNPSVYLDELPQPYRFVNKVLQEMILQPVNEAITKIEERKKTTEYEGYTKEATATGSMDLQGVTCMVKVGPCIGPGGVVEKQEQSSTANKVLIGDNYGQISLVDVSRKICLDKFKVPGFESRRIVSISSSTIEWVGT